MAKKIQKITEERNVPDDIVENAATPDVMPDANTVNDDNTVAPDLNVVENPSASVSDSITITVRKRNSFPFTECRGC